VDRPGRPRRVDLLIMGYYYRRPPRPSRNPGVEMTLTVLVVAVLVVVTVLFLFVYHDVPLRTS
jgi:hypothetical protein